MDFKKKTEIIIQTYFRIIIFEIIRKEEISRVKIVLVNFGITANKQSETEQIKSIKKNRIVNMICKMRRT